MRVHTYVTLYSALCDNTSTKVYTTGFKFCPTQAIEYVARWWEIMTSRHTV